MSLLEFGLQQPGISASRQLIESSSDNSSGIVKAVPEAADSLYDIAILEGGPAKDHELSDAITNLLRKNAGSLVHADFVVRSLFGKLELDAQNRVSSALTSALEQGAIEGRWMADNQSLDCYYWEQQPVSEDYISESELLALIERGDLSLDDMRQLSNELTLTSYGSIKRTDTFAAFLARNNVKRSEIKNFLQLKVQDNQ